LKELELIHWIAERAPSAAGLATGIGDDCAVLDCPGGGCVVVTTDMLLEGTHFSADDSPEDVGYKAVAVSISDVAAMGCRSLHAFLAVGLPAVADSALARGLFDGAVAAANRFGVSLAGGDTTRSPGGLSICSTLVGAPPEGRTPILRSGARPGQALAVTGDLGGSLSGHHLRFVPRQTEALQLVEEYAVGGMIDLSDGLSSDAWHLARMSGVRLRLFADRIPISPRASAADPLGAALNDGEDFELLFTVASEECARLSGAGLAGTPITIIGEVLAGTPGVTLVDSSGRETDLKAGGYEHFSR